jgi:hypothetical protein
MDVHLGNLDLWFVRALLASLVFVALARQPMDDWTFRKKARQQIRKYEKTLAIKRYRGLRRDDYGNLIDENWRKEVEYFYTAVILPRLKSAWTGELH